MINTFYDWYQSLHPMLKVYWTIAILASLVFIIQMVLTFVGIGDSDGDASFDTDAASVGDTDGDTLGTGGAMQLFTLRNLVNFLLGIGWGGVCLWGVSANKSLVALMAILCGAAMVALFVVMFRQVMKLESNGNFDINDCAGMTCDVYMRIPAHREAQGKVQISIGGSVQELPAVTDGEMIASGTKVQVTSVVDGLLIVAPLSE